MFGTLLIGISYALSAGLQPGPLQAFFLSKVVENGWRRTLPAAFAPLVSDGPIALVSILLLKSTAGWIQRSAAAGRIILLLFFAWGSFQNWRRAEEPESAPPGSTPRTVLQAALINLLNPHPYLGWSLVMGPAVLTAWAEGPGMALALLLAFYIAMISTSMVMIYLMGRAILLGPSARKGLNLISALLLTGLGLYFLYTAAGSLASWIG